MPQNTDLCGEERPEAAAAAAAPRRGSVVLMGPKLPNQGLSGVIFTFVLSVSILPLSWDSNEALVIGCSPPDIKTSTERFPGDLERTKANGEKRVETRALTVIRDLKVQVKVRLKTAPPDGSIGDKHILGRRIVRKVIKLNSTLLSGKPLPLEVSADWSINLEAGTDGAAFQSLSPREKKVVKRLTAIWK